MQLAKDVKDEPGTWGYLVHSGAAGSSPPCSEGTIVFVEIYANESAYKAHVEGPIFSKFMSTYGDLFQQRPGGGGAFVEVLNIDRLAGFVRPEAC